VDLAEVAVRVAFVLAREMPCRLRRRTPHLPQRLLAFLLLRRRGGAQITRAHAAALHRGRATEPVLCEVIA
jgi:hypothetical protein